MNVDDVEPVVKVFSKPARRNFLFQVPVGGCHHSDVDLETLFTADPFEDLVLQDPEKFHLDGGIDFPDFVQEDGPAVGQLETALFLADGPGETPFFMAEEFTLQKSLGKGRTVGLDERTVPAF